MEEPEERFDDETSRRLFTMPWDRLVAYLGCHPKHATDKFINYEGRRHPISSIWAAEYEQLKIRRFMEANGDSYEVVGTDYHQSSLKPCSDSHQNHDGPPQKHGGSRPGAGRPPRQEDASKVIKSVRLTTQEVVEFEAQMLDRESWSNFLRRQLEGSIALAPEDLELIARNSHEDESPVEYIRRLLRRDEHVARARRKQKGS